MDVCLGRVCQVPCSWICGRNSVGRMPASQAGRRRFESGRPLCRPSSPASFLLGGACCVPGGACGLSSSSPRVGTLVHIQHLRLRDVILSVPIPPRALKSSQCCPVCSGDNGCAMATGAADASSCWCNAPAAYLAVDRVAGRLPAPFEEPGSAPLACYCAGCLGSHRSTIDRPS